MTDEYIVNGAELKEVADKLREKSNKSEGLVFPTEFVEKVDAVYVEGKKLFIENVVTKLTPENMEGITQIAKRCFYHNQDLVSIDLPASVNYVQSGAFYGCPNLKSANISKVARAGDQVFFKCTSLKGTLDLSSMSYLNSAICKRCSSLSKIVFGKNLGTICAGAFSGCTSMKEYDFSACTKIPTLKDVDVFDDIPSDCRIVVPYRYLSTWKIATNWVKFASQISTKTSTFKIASSSSQEETYEYEVGMTFGDWLNSEYNTGSFYVTSRGITKYYKDGFVAVLNIKEDISNVTHNTVCSQGMVINDIGSDQRYGYVIYPKES